MVQIITNYSPLLGGYGDGKVYALNRTHAVKIPLDESKVAGLSHELEVQEEFYRAGVNVPFPIGIEPVRILDLYTFPITSVEKTGLVMERLEGTELIDLSDDLFYRVFRLYREQVDRATELGFKLHDHDPDPDGIIENAIYVPLRQDVFLVDFHRCERV